DRERRQLKGLPGRAGSDHDRSRAPGGPSSGVLRHPAHFDSCGETRYTRRMTGNTSLPPHLERFVREQVAAGRFRCEAHVIRAAPRPWGAPAPARGPPGPGPRKPVTGLPRRPVQPATTPEWETPGKGATPAPARRSPRGLLADFRSDLSFDDIRDARGEL